MPPPRLLTRASIQCSDTATEMIKEGVPQDDFGSHVKVLRLRHDSDAPGNHVPVLFHRLPGGGHPRHCGTLCGEASASPATLCRLPLYG
jgi:hypothetical protein